MGERAACCDHPVVAGQDVYTAAGELIHSEEKDYREFKSEFERKVR